MSKTIAMYQPWTVIQGGLIDDEVDEVEVDKKDVVYLVTANGRILGTFNDFYYVKQCFADYPNANLIELEINKRLDK